MEIQNARTGSRTPFLLVHAIVRRFCAAITGDTMSSNMSVERRRERGAARNKVQSLKHTKVGKFGLGACKPLFVLLCNIIM